MEQTAQHARNRTQEILTSVREQITTLSYCVSRTSVAGWALCSLLRLANDALMQAIKLLEDSTPAYRVAFSKVPQDVVAEDDSATRLIRRVLILHEKHGQQILDVTGDVRLHNVADAVLRSRRYGGDGWYGDLKGTDQGTQIDEILEHQQKRQAWLMLENLSHREYERVELVSLTTPEELVEDLPKGTPG